MCVRGRWSGLGVVLSAVILAGCSRMPTPGSDGTRDPTPLPENKVEHSAASDLFVGRVWRVTEAPSQPAFGSAYIFLANGTLVEMSCGEPYRIALWTREPDNARVLHVTEDKQPAFVGTIRDLSETTLRMDQKLTRSADVRALTLTAVKDEFVCPDLGK